MDTWTVEFYETASGRIPVAEYLQGLDARNRQAITRVLVLLQQMGTALSLPHARPVQGKLWELRVTGRVAHRVFYFATSGQRFVLLHAFAKRTQATPQREIDTALSRLRDYETRMTS
jgi:phage-related protein